MAHILPKINKLEAMMKILRINAKSKRQQVVAEEVIQEYAGLVEYARFLTRVLNEDDQDDSPIDYNTFWDHL